LGKEESIYVIGGKDRGKESITKTKFKGVFNIKMDVGER
jgi:hypothetical protein